MMLDKIREDVKRVLIPAVKSQVPADIAALIDDEFICMLTRRASLLWGVLMETPV